MAGGTRHGQRLAPRQVEAEPVYSRKVSVRVRQIMGWPQEELQLPESLKGGILDGECVAFVGSGASVGCYPSWHSLIELICEACGSSHSVTVKSTPEQLMEAADDAKKCDPDEYFRCLHKHFKVKPTTRTIYQLLAKLPFASYLTTNFDELLVKNINITRCNDQLKVMEFPNFDPSEVREGAVFYLHGLIHPDRPPKDGTIVLSKSEFAAAYAENTQLVYFLTPTLVRKDICFIGYSLREHSMERVLHICKAHQAQRQESAASGGTTCRVPQRHILLPRPELPDSDHFDEAASRDEMTKEEVRLKGFDIETVWYSPAADHSALDGAFERLLNIPKYKISC